VHGVVIRAKKPGKSGRIRARDPARLTDSYVQARQRPTEDTSMNRRDLVKAIAAQTETDVKTVDAVLKGFTDVTTAVVSKGEPVAITGFAKFSKVERAARMGRNPATGEAIKIKASKKARITPLKGFKDAVMTPSTAPKLNKGVWPPA
jgi:DNA-binding protein HU-beta